MNMNLQSLLCSLLKHYIANMSTTIQTSGDGGEPTSQEGQEGAPTPVDKSANSAQSVLPAGMVLGIAAVVSWLLAQNIAMP